MKEKEFQIRRRRLYELMDSTNKLYESIKEQSSRNEDFWYIWGYKLGLDEHYHKHRDSTILKPYDVDHPDCVLGWNDARADRESILNG